MMKRREWVTGLGTKQMNWILALLFKGKISYFTSLSLVFSTYVMEVNINKYASLLGGLNMLIKCNKVPSTLVTFK